MNVWLIEPYLSYPGLIPTAHHSTCLYRDFDGLLTRLRHALTHIDDTRAFSLQRHVAQYNWRHMIPHYDTFFGELGPKTRQTGNL